MRNLKSEMLRGKLLCGTFEVLLKLHFIGQSLFVESHGMLCSEIKERIKKTKDEKKAKKAETISKQQKTQSKGNVPKTAATKAPKLGGGKR